jgi:molecular chaperone GrpE
VTEEASQDETSEAQGPESGPDSQTHEVDEASAGTSKSGAEPAEDEAPDPLQAAQDEAQRLRDQLLRTAADFDNFRKRARREVSDAELKGREDLLKQLLPVFDNLERAAEHAANASEAKGVAEGIDLVMKQFLDTLVRMGIEKIDAAGQAFDPTRHEAIQQLETGEVPPGSVAHQVQAGYRMGERLVRPAMVVVAKAPNPGDSS